MGKGHWHKSCKSWGLLALRLAIGFIFIYMGYSKLGPGHAGAVAMMAGKVGWPGGGEFWAYFVGSLELLGGIMLILGAYVRVAAVWLAIILLVAMATVHRGGRINGYFLPLAMLGSIAALSGTGAGRYRLIKQECWCQDCRNGDGGCSCGPGGGCGCGGNCGGNCGHSHEPEQK